jgi:tripeptide aminopeptidase
LFSTGYANIFKSIFSFEVIIVNLLERFIKYAKYETTSDPLSEKSPSTETQTVFAAVLADDIEKAGLKNVKISSGGIVTAELPATEGCEDLPVIGFIAHMDTSPDMSGRNVNPILIENYDGSDIVFPKGGDILSPKDFPDLKNHLGKTLITADGSTLLGADDKAGIAEIIEAIIKILKNDIAHGKVMVAFTPDEEIGRGMENFDIPSFGADFAYTVDGGAVNLIQYECFNAASLRVSVSGFNIHPGTAKNRMVNASLIAMEFDSMLPAQMRPQFTEGYEGFFHLSKMSGSEEKASLFYIIRDHSKQLFEEKKSLAVKICDFLNNKYGDNTVAVDIKDSYKNMREAIEPHIHVVERAMSAMKKLGLEPAVEPIRGGTDGSFLSLSGLPCPNLPTGGSNFHGRFEYITLEDMDLVSDIIVEIIRAK